jgi:hypothetical protein
MKRDNRITCIHHPFEENEKSRQKKKTVRKKRKIRSLLSVDHATLESEVGLVEDTTKKDGVPLNHARVSSDVGNTIYCGCH